MSNGDEEQRGRPLKMTAADAVSALPTLEVTGELDLAAAPWLRDQLDALFVGGAASIVVDLSAATFLDSTALGVLVTAHHHSRSLGGRMHLIVCEPQILRVLAITGLIEEFAVHESGAAQPGAAGGAGGAKR